MSKACCNFWHDWQRQRETCKTTGKDNVGHVKPLAKTMWDTDKGNVGHVEPLAKTMWDM